MASSKKFVVKREHEDGGESSAGGAKKRRAAAKAAATAAPVTDTEEAQNAMERLTVSVPLAKVVRAPVVVLPEVLPMKGKAVHRAMREVDHLHIFTGEGTCAGYTTHPGACHGFSQTGEPVDTEVNANLRLFPCISQDVAAAADSLGDPENTLDVELRNISWDVDKGNGVTHTRLFALFSGVDSLEYTYYKTHQLYTQFSLRDTPPALQELMYNIEQTQYGVLGIPILLPLSVGEHDLSKNRYKLVGFVISAERSQGGPMGKGVFLNCLLYFDIVDTPEVTFNGWKDPTWSDDTDGPIPKNIPARVSMYVCLDPATTLTRLDV